MRSCLAMQCQARHHGRTMLRGFVKFCLGGVGAGRLSHVTRVHTAPGAANARDLAVQRGAQEKARRSSQYHRGFLENLLCRCWRMAKSTGNGRCKGGFGGFG